MMITIGIKLKGLSWFVIFHLKGHAVKLKCVNNKIFWRNMIFAKKYQF